MNKLQKNSIKDGLLKKQNMSNACWVFTAGKTKFLGIKHSFLRGSNIYLAVLKFHNVYFNENSYYEYSLQSFYMCEPASCLLSKP